MHEYDSMKPALPAETPVAPTIVTDAETLREQTETKQECDDS